MSSQPIPDTDYILSDGAAWLEVKNFSIRIAATDEGVSVDIYRKGDEMGGAVTSTYAYDNEDNTPEREDHFRDDVEADADALASAGYGTDEDYGYHGGYEE